jgi:hypothetical protein
VGHADPHTLAQELTDLARAELAVFKFPAVSRSWSGCLVQSPARCSASSSAKRVVTDRPGWWRLVPPGTAPALKAAVAVESLLVDGGRTVRLEHHLRRYRCSCEQMGLELDECMLHSLAAEIGSTLPVIGRWFPRLEARDGSPAPVPRSCRSEAASPG